MEKSHKSLIINFQKNVLDDFITCGICSCYFNFAHTLVDCGHTFCRRCIYQHFKKSKVAKCPRCGEGIEKNFSRSVKRDPYKQSLVDLLHPKFNEQDNQIIKRCRQLFPEVDIQAIKDELDSSQWDFYPKKKRKQLLESKLQTSLDDAAVRVLGIPLDVFAKDILDNDKFDAMIQKKVEFEKNVVPPPTTTTATPAGATPADANKTKETQDYFFSLYPKSDDDWKIVGLKNALSAPRSKPVSAAQLKKFLLNHVLTKYKNSENPPFEKAEASIEGIILSLKDRALENNETIEDLKKKVGDTTNLFIYYELAFKKVPKDDKPSDGASAGAPGKTA
jgi:hypothetical protein